VIDLAHETRPDILRQVALLQQQEIERLHHRLAQLVAQLARAHGQDATTALQLELTQLREQLAAAQQRLFGRSSERRNREGAAGGTKEGSEDTQQRAPRTGHGPRAQTTLPLVDVVHELDPADRTCTACGGALTAMAGQFEDAEEVDVVERSFRIVRHRRQKYRCTCGGCLETALGPSKLIPGGRYSVDFAVAVAVAKYVDHLPLARQVRQMARAGLTVDTQTLWDQLQALAGHLAPSYAMLHDKVLEAPVIGADETTWRLLEKGGSKRWYAWSIAAPNAVFYRIDPSRSARAAQAILRDYAGIVVADGYSAYHTLARERAAARDGPCFALAHCWAHVRRKFVEAEAAYPQAREAIDQIRKLYEIEAAVREAEPAERRRVRDVESRPLVDALQGWLRSTPALPQSALGKAISYTAELWKGLVRFLEDPAIPLDNNATERALRGVCVGRKNHYGSKSLRGTQVAALFYSLVESAKLAGLEPATYLAEATRRAIAAPGTVTLPSHLARS
jgi:transposase